MVQKTNFKWLSQSSCVRGERHSLEFQFSGRTKSTPDGNRNPVLMQFFRKFPFSGHYLIEAETSKIAKKMRLEFPKWRTISCDYFNLKIVGFCFACVRKMKEISFFRPRNFSQKKISRIKHTPPRGVSFWANKKSRENFLNLWLLCRCSCT